MTIGTLSLIATLVITLLGHVKTSTQH